MQFRLLECANVNSLRFNYNESNPEFVSVHFEGPVLSTNVRVASNSEFSTRLHSEKRLRISLAGAAFEF